MAEREVLTGAMSVALVRMLIDARIEVGGQNGDQHSIACSDAGVTEPEGFCDLVGSVVRSEFV
ncbi:hypothetical protein [Micromonospora sp. KC721]|uniref:hypothetical protein n=1 Tax=Micromonospora sp. KC721 TaxID=2530380 RepID=UPI00105293C4|nr:hypothetical protein [Micromonospora sp. KC721]TDB80428.1 hypothetical protein E1182_09160 [Micromonospora sp. KC721]